MVESHNVNLKSKNSFHINATVKNFYTPENEEELKMILEKLGDNNYYILSGGSNILLNDKKEYENIIYMAKIDNTIIDMNDGKFYIGCSNRIQNVINEINKLGYGGIEKLYSIPAMFGGIIYMNAGIGSKSNPIVTISEFVDRVKVFNKTKLEIEWIDKNECCFSHRKSIFQNNQYIILGAECTFKNQELELSKKIINERISFFQKNADMGLGTFGTVFSNASGVLLKIVALLKSRKGNIRFGRNNKNWLVNDGNGTYEEAINIINRCKRIHKLFHKELELEVRIWE